MKVNFSFKRNSSKGVILPHRLEHDPMALWCLQDDFYLSVLWVKFISKQTNLHVFSMDLTSVPVGGVVEVMVTYLYDADGGVTAARLRCVPGRGTFPAFSWSLNHTSLPAESDSHALAQHAQILIITHITAVTAGYYRCAVRDSFNHNSMWLESSDIHIQKTGNIISLLRCVRQKSLFQKLQVTSLFTAHRQM